MTLDLLRRHIEQLTANVPIYPVKRLHQAKAIRDLDGEVLELWLPSIRSCRSYATALHEVGHMKGRYQKSRDTLVRERWAWQWARENALIWTEDMERAAARSLAWSR